MQPYLTEDLLNILFLHRPTAKARRNGGETCAAAVNMSAQVRSAKDAANFKGKDTWTSPLKHEERGFAGELHEAAKTNDFCALNVTGSSDNKGLIDEVCNGNFESSSILQQQLPLEQPNKSHQHTQHLQQAPPARPLSYRKEPCKQGNECKNGTILLQQNEKVVEPIMDKRFAERNQIVLFTSEQETSVTSSAGDAHDDAVKAGVLRGADFHRHNQSCANTISFNNNLDNEQNCFTTTTTASTQKIMSSGITMDHTETTDDHVAITRSHISQVKRVSQESSSKTTLFVAGLPASSSHDVGRAHHEKLVASRLSCFEEASRGKLICFMAYLVRFREKHVFLSVY